MTAVLALDSALSACSAAVVDGGGTLLARQVQAMERGHAAALVPMVVATMAASGLTFRDLGALAVTVGPGSFTGVRVGVAAARGLALASGLPLLGFSTFEAIARAIPDDEAALVPPSGATRLPLRLVAIDTKRRDLYVQAYGADGRVVLAGCVARPDELAARLPAGEVLVAGDGAGPAAAALAAAGRPVRLVPDAVLPDAIHVARLAIERLSQGRSALPPRPIYLRAPEATVPAAGGRLRPTGKADDPGHNDLGCGDPGPDDRGGGR